LALKVIQLEAKNVQLEVKIGKLETKVEQQDSLLTSLLREKNERRAAASTDSVRPIGNNQSTVSINGLPSSCGDLALIGHTLSGIYSVMGSAKMESVFCDFTKLPDDAGKSHFTLFSCNFQCFNSKLMKRFSKMDRIRRRQIGARPFLRPEKFFIFRRIHSDSVPVGGSERGKRHEFDIGEIHGTAAGNLFFLFRGSGASFFFICCRFLF
jgi:hypothetical protein